jgi:hypothetical protein
MSAIGPAIISATGRASSRAALVGSYAMSYFCGGLSHDGLLFFVGPDSTGSIGLSSDFYTLVGPILQPLLFSDADTPTPITMAEFLAIPELNTENFFGSESKGAAIYFYADWETDFDKRLAWFVPTVAPTSLDEMTISQIDGMTVDEIDAATI